MGNVRSRIIKRLSKDIILNFYDQLNLEFENNKQVVQEVTNVRSKTMRNKVAGYTTNLMRQIQEDKIQTLEELE